MSLVEVNFSELINKPRRTLAMLTGPEARVMALRLARRDDVDLVVMTADRYGQERSLITALSRLLTELLRSGSDELALDLVRRVLPAAYPWIRFLPAQDGDEFVKEFAEVLQAAESIDNLAPVAQLVTEWRHTAEIHADPELAATLLQDAEDFGPVPEPIEADAA
jgi:hypothetical protein